MRPVGACSRGERSELLAMLPSETRPDPGRVKKIEAMKMRFFLIIARLAALIVVGPSALPLLLEEGSNGGHRFDGRDNQASVENILRVRA